MKGKYEIDGKDESILEVLKGNSSLSIQNIAKKTGIPIATVHNRIKKMRNLGIIRRYTIDIDKAKLGRAMIVFIAVKATQRADHQQMLHEIFKHGLVEEGAVTAGQFDLLFRVRVRDMDELNSFVLQYLRKLETVADTSTMISYEWNEKF